MNVNKLRNSLINSELSIAAVARKTKLSRTALHNFINGGSIRESTAKKIDIVLHNLDKDISLTGGHNMEASKIIDLQDKTINYQEEKIASLSKENTELKKVAYAIQSKAWNELDYHFYSDVRINFIPFQRKVIAMEGSGVDILADRLKLDKDTLLNKYFSLKQWHKFNEHPCDQIVSKKNLIELKKLSVNMPSLFDSLKTMIGEHYFEQIIIYEHNGITVPSVCKIKIHWLESPIRAECKSEFITD